MPLAPKHSQTKYFLSRGGAGGGSRGGPKRKKKLPKSFRRLERMRGGGGRGFLEKLEHERDQDPEGSVVFGGVVGGWARQPRHRSREGNKGIHPCGVHLVNATVWQALR